MMQAPVITLDDLAQNNDVAVDALPQSFFVALSERMERALTGNSRQPLITLSGKLDEAFDHIYKRAAVEVRKALRDEQPGPLLQAYRLGQLSYAQALASKAMDRRVPDEFISLINDAKYLPLISALWQRDLNGRDLASQVGESDESISRKLSLLRDKGITDFWREGRQVFNHLTPAARAAAPASCRVAAPAAASAPQNALRDRLERLDPRMSSIPSFATGR